MPAWLLILLVVLPLWVRDVSAQVLVGRDCQLDWTASVYPDGTPAPDIAEYHVYVRQLSGTYNFSKPQDRVKADGRLQSGCRKLKISIDGSYAAVVTAINRSNEESVVSDEVVFIRDTAAPPAPGAFTVIDRPREQGEQ